MPSHLTFRNIFLARKSNREGRWCFKEYYDTKAIENNLERLCTDSIIHRTLLLRLRRERKETKLCLKKQKGISMVKNPRNIKSNHPVAILLKRFDRVLHDNRKKEYYNSNMRSHPILIFSGHGSRYCMFLMILRVT